MFSSGAWVLPVSAAAFAGRFGNEIQTFVQDIVSKYHSTYLSSNIVGIYRGINIYNVYIVIILLLFSQNHYSRMIAIRFVYSKAAITEKGEV